MGNPCPLARIVATLVPQKYIKTPPPPSETTESFPPFRGPIVDNFSRPRANLLTLNTAQKIKKIACVMKHLFASFNIFRHSAIGYIILFHYLRIR